MSPPVKTIGSVVGDDIAHTQTMDRLGRLLVDEGINLMDVAEGQLERGTPVYVDAAAPAVEVQRRMAQFHIRRLAVVGDGALLGIVDLVDLAISESG
jgi:CBS domain-containing protein